MWLCLHYVQTKPQNRQREKQKTAENQQQSLKKRRKVVCVDRVLQIELEWFDSIREAEEHLDKPRDWLPELQSRNNISPCCCRVQSTREMQANTNNKKKFSEPEDRVYLLFQACTFGKCNCRRMLPKPGLGLCVVDKIDMMIKTGEMGEVGGVEETSERW